MDAIMESSGKKKRDVCTMLGVESDEDAKIKLADFEQPQKPAKKAKK